MILINILKINIYNVLKLIYRQQGIDPTLSPLGSLIRFLTISENFGEEIFALYVGHYKRIFTILEVLATKDNLDIHRQVFSLVRNYINKNNIKLTVTDLVNIHQTERFGRLVYTPIELSPGLRITILR